MRAMILAAGLGSRMRPLTDHTPKPLLKVAGRYLIEFHLERLAEAGIRDVVVNTHWLAQQIHETLGDGSRWGLNIQYSHETDLLETAGGIVQALPLLSEAMSDDEVFLLINGDVYTELDLKAWLAQAPSLTNSKNAYLALVENPEHNPQGDFSYRSSERPLALNSPSASALSQEAQVNSGGQAFTYAGIALFHVSFFKGLPEGSRPLGPLLKQAIAKETVFGSIHCEYWLDVGTPERLKRLQSRLA